MSQRFEFQSSFSVPPERLFDWHARPGAFGRLLPPWQRATLGRSALELVDGSRMEFGLRKGPFKFRWVAEHSEVEPGRRFVDTQVNGPFRRWRHAHEFLQREAGASKLLDRIENCYFFAQSQMRK